MQPARVMVSAVAAMASEKRFIQTVSQWICLIQCRENQAKTRPKFN
jgi:hypothetical protein